MSASVTLRKLSGLPAEPAPLSESVLILVDAQNTYRHGVMALEGIEPALDECARLLARAAQERALINADVGFHFGLIDHELIALLDEAIERLDDAEVTQFVALLAAAGAETLTSVAGRLLPVTRFTVCIKSSVSLCFATIPMSETSSVLLATVSKLRFAVRSRPTPMLAPTIGLCGSALCRQI